jgi:hypothetical protein
MDESHESLMSLSQVRPMIVSPDLPPQLNQCVCGCRSGCGCGCPGDGNDKEYDCVSIAETAVEFVDFDEEHFTHDEHTPDEVVSSRDTGLWEAGIHAPRASMHPDLVWRLTVLGRFDDSPSGEPFVGWQEMTLPATFFDGFEDANERLYDQVLDIETQGNAVSERASVHMSSPGPVMEEWVQLTPEMVHNDPVYIFTPLRLSAESKHARGKMAEHLLVPDVAFVPELVQE